MDACLRVLIRGGVLNVQLFMCRCSDHQATLPGCPPTSIARRRWLHHNSCGATIDPDNPAYYEYGIVDDPGIDYGGAAAPDGDFYGAGNGPGEAPDNFLSIFCSTFFYDDPDGDYPEGATVTDVPGPSCCECGAALCMHSRCWKLLHCCNLR